MATGATAQRIIDVVTPAAGESVSEGTILEWHVKVGDFIKATDTIVEISTEKVDVVTVGQVIARIAAGDAPRADTDGSTASGNGGTSGGATPPPAAAAPAPPPPAAPPSAEVQAPPPAAPAPASSPPSAPAPA